MIRARHKYNANISDKVNLTSMTDVLMTLLILFMLMETAEALMGFNLNMPSVVQVKTPDDPTILITYSAEKKLFITTNRFGDENINRVLLKTRLAELRKKYAYDTIVIKADRILRYKDIIGLMDDAKQAGFEQISLATGL